VAVGDGFELGGGFNHDLRDVGGSAYRHAADVAARQEQQVRDEAPHPP
jgi:hypothetical protein